MDMENLVPEEEEEGVLLLTDENGVVTAVEYNIDFEGKTDEEIQLITDYLKYIEYLDKWDGKLPSVMTGDSASIMIPTQP